jgi:hypothetical protein
VHRSRWGLFVDRWHFPSCIHSLSTFLTLSDFFLVIAAVNSEASLSSSSFNIRHLQSNNAWFQWRECYFRYRFIGCWRYGRLQTVSIPCPHLTVVAFSFGGLVGPNRPGGKAFTGGSSGTGEWRCGTTMLGKPLWWCHKYYVTSSVNETVVICGAIRPELSCLGCDLELRTTGRHWAIAGAERSPAPMNAEQRCGTGDGLGHRPCWIMVWTNTEHGTRTRWTEWPGFLLGTFFDTMSDSGDSLVASNPFMFSSPWCMRWNEMKRLP